MLEKPKMSWNHVIGKRVIKDVFSKNGTLLIPTSTIITQDHTIVLDKHGVSLTEDETEEVGPYVVDDSFEYSALINESVGEISQLFEGVRATNEVPLAELRKNIVPMIQEVASQDPSPQLIGLFATLQSKDDYTYRHNIAVGVIANLIGTWMKLDRHELLQLTTAALLHDVGKMLIPKEVLNKPGKLTDEEYELMKNHTVLGYHLLKRTVGLTHRQAIVALQHHERLDGSGYPLGLKRDKIDMFSRITSVADVFHAMTSKRVYRDPSPFYEVLSQMEKDIFGMLDPKITRLFMEKIMNSLIGHSVLLTDGSKGTILLIHHQAPTRPLIQIDHRFIDLNKDSSVQIKQIL